MSSSLTVQEQERKDLLAEMREPTQKLAINLEDRIGRVNTAGVLVQYDLGAQVAAAMDDPDKYGDMATRQIAAYLKIPGGVTTLTNLVNVSKAFDRKFIEAQVGEAMPDGRPLTITHFVALQRLDGSKARDKMLKRIRTECMSGQDVEAEVQASGRTKNVRKGGRKQKKPTSDLAGLQQLHAKSQQLDNYLPLMDDIFASLESISASKVTERTVERFNTATATLTKTRDDIQAALKRMEAVGKRLDRVMSGKESDENAAETAAPKASAKSSKKKGKKKGKKKLPATV
jgi:hypothetical protein